MTHVEGPIVYTPIPCGFLHSTSGLHLTWSFGWSVPAADDHYLSIPTEVLISLLVLKYGKYSLLIQLRYHWTLQEELHSKANEHMTKQKEKNWQKEFRIPCF